jgi:hypothetical protein
MQSIKAFLTMIGEAFFSRNGSADDDYLELTGPGQLSSDDLLSSETGGDRATNRLTASGRNTPEDLARTEH